MHCVGLVVAMAPICLLFLESVAFGGILPDYISLFLLLITQCHGVNYKARWFILACGSRYKGQRIVPVDDLLIGRSQDVSEHHG